MNGVMSQSQMMSNLVVLYRALDEFLLKFAQSTTSRADHESVVWYDNNNKKQTINIPSYGNMRSDIDRLKSDLHSMIENNSDTINLAYPDGNIRTFAMQKMSKLVDLLNSTSDVSLSNPTEFRAKSNWMFESFLNPLLSIPVNVSGMVGDTSMSKFSVRRVIMNSSDADDIRFFDSNLKGVNTLRYDDVLDSFRNAGIAYDVDDNEYELPSSINRRRGSFNVLRIDESSATIDGIVVKRVYYTLDVLFYTDVLSANKGKTYLAEGDVLVTSGDSEYVVRAIDSQTNRVLLERSFGKDIINVGVGVLKIRPEAYRIPELSVNVGYSEREVIFVKPIAAQMDMTTDVWSKGFGVYTNELSILLSGGKSMSLGEYYTNYVSDFGLVLMNFAKERQIPSVLGMTPNAPVVNAADMAVVNINNHIKSSKSTSELKTKIAGKDNIKNEIESTNKVINDYRAKLNTSATATDQDRLNTQKKITDLLNKKTGLQKQLNTMLDELTFDIKTNINLSVSAKYRVRGFFPMPLPVENEYGKQEVIQFVVSYRYKNKSGGTSSAKNIPLTGDGQTNAYFSEWVEVFSKIRKKEFDSATGLYVWSDENVQDPDVVNINQIDIPINKGEIVEFRVKSVSEAGYPINPVMSDWSDIIPIEFPAEMEMREEDVTLTERLLIESSLVDFQDELNSRGLDIHLYDSITKGDKYYPHKLESIASGMFTQEGNIIDAYAVISDFKSRIAALELAITNSIGEIRVYVVEKDGTRRLVSNGENVSIFAGYYDQEKLGVGGVVSYDFLISIENSAGVPLELVSRFGAGIGLPVPSSSTVTDGDYAWRKYDKVPMSVLHNETPDVGGFKNVVGYQSGQSMSQFINSRYYDFPLEKELYHVPVVANSSYDFTGAFYTGFGTVPTDGRMLLPIAPSSHQIIPMPDENVNIWNGHADLTGSFAINGGGSLSEFCIDKNCPWLEEYLTAFKAANPDTDYMFGSDINKAVFKPAFTKNNNVYKQSVMPICHAVGFDVQMEETTNGMGINYLKQSAYSAATTYSSGVPTTLNYPTKIGFNENDEYLIGKYTCGAYLYLSPKDYESISIKGNHQSLSSAKLKSGQENAINIPVVFQYRCQDKLGYVGGYSAVGKKRTNVTYMKQMGIDIYQKVYQGNSGRYDDVFSFDITVQCKHKPDVATSSVNTSSISGTKSVYNVIKNLK